jgi:hypothetical protein
MARDRGNERILHNLFFIYLVGYNITVKGHVERKDVIIM